MIDKTALKRRLIEQKEEAEIILGQNLVEREMQKEFLKILDAPPGKSNHGAQAQW
ncbi:MAG TPA: hypothetical protein VK469_16920 [Candidatus Kapabacteria bacterium]|nr:hypothetical protein [Candidatus Kapabacteria bacterium]